MGKISRTLSRGRRNPRKLSISALGPVALIYWDETLDDAARMALARGLVEDAKAPAVLFRNKDGATTGWMNGRPLRLPQFAGAHPADRLCRAAGTPTGLLRHRHDGSN